MPVLPQAPRWEDPQEVRNIIKKYRQETGDSSKTDYEISVILDKRHKGYSGLSRSETADELYKDHMRIKSPAVYNLEYGKNDPTPRWDLDAPIRPKKDRSMAGHVMGLGGLVDTLPDWLGNAVKQGANESITGIAAAIISGDVPFDIDDDYDPNMVESALGFGVGLTYDFWFFAATKGFGLGPALAGQTAKKAAAKVIAKQFMGRNAGAMAKELGVKGLGTGVSHKRWINKAIQGTNDVESATTALKAAAKAKNIKLNPEVLNHIIEKSIKEAGEELPKLLQKPSFLTKGLQKFGDEGLGKGAIDAPSLGRMFNHFGAKGSVGLGLYEASAEAGRQWRDSIQKRTNPDTGQPYTYGEATHIIDRMKEEDNPDFNPDIQWDFEQIAWRTLHGAAGGYIAGGVGGVMQAGRLGAFKGKKGLGDKVEKKIGEWTYGKAMELSLEAGGFTGTSSMINFMETGSLDGGTGEGLGDMFIHNLVTVGVLKGMGWMKPKAFDAGVDMTANALRKFKTMQLKGIEKTANALKGQKNDITNGMLKELKKQEIEITEKIEKDIEAFQERANRIKEILTGVSIGKKGIKFGKGGYTVVKDADGKNIRVPNMTGKEGRELIELVKDLNKYKDDILKEHQIPPEQVKKMFPDGNIFDLIEANMNQKGKWADKFIAELDAADLRRGTVAAEKVKEGKEIDVAEKEAEASRKEELDSKNAANKLRLDTENALETTHGVSEVRGENGKLVKLKKATQEELDSALKALENKHVKDLEKAGLLKREQGNTIEVALEKIKNEPLSTTIKKTIKKVLFGDSKIDSENASVLEFIAKRNSKTAKGIQGGDVRNASMFAKWLFGKHKISLKDATQSHLQEYLDTGNNGKPFGYGSKDINGRKKSNKQKIIDTMRWVKQLNGLKGQSLNDVESLTVSKMERLTARELENMEKLGKKKRQALEPSVSVPRIENFNKELSEGKDIPLKSGKKVSNTAGHFISYIVGIMGKRAQTLKDMTFNANDVGIIGGELRITVTDKTGQNFILTVPKGEIMGVNYYEIFNKIRKLPAGTEILTDSTGKRLSISDLIELGQKITGEGSVHISRDNVYEIAAELDLQQSKNSAGKWSVDYWTNFARDSLVGHGLKKAGSGNESLYGAGQSATSLPANIKLFWEGAQNLKSKKQISLDLDGKENLGKQMSKEMRDRKKAEREGLAPETLDLMDKLERWELERSKMKDTGTDVYSIITRKIETAKKNLAVKLAKSQLEVRNPLYGKALNRIVTLLASRNKGLEVYIEKYGKEAGEFVNDIIKVTEGKADATTFFHENVHRLEKFIRATGDKKLLKLWEQAEADVIRYAKKHHSKLYEQYDRGYGFDKNGKRLPNAEKIIANELMTQLAAESALRQFSREGTWLGRSKNLINRLVSQLRTSLGFGSMKDVARLYGDIARRGFSTDGIKLSIGQKKYQIYNSGEKPSSEQKIEYGKIHREKKLDAAMVRVLIEKQPGLWDIVNNKLSGDMKINPKTGEVTGADAKQLALLTDLIKVSVDTRKYDSSVKVDHAKLLDLTYLTRKIYGITIEQSRAMAKELGVPGNGSLKNASELQIKRLQEFYGQFGKRTPVNEMVLNESMLDTIADKSAEFNDLRKGVTSLTMSVSYVLKKMGFKKLSHAISDHYISEATLVGIGAQAVFETQAIAGKKGLDYIPYALDAELLKPSMIDGKLVHPKADAKRDAWLAESKVEGTKQFEAVARMEKMFNDYWNEFLLRANRQIKNPAEFEQFLKEYNKKFVQGYFTRVLTKEAQKNLKHGITQEASVEYLIKNNLEAKLKTLTPNQAEMLTREMGKKDSDAYINMKREAEHQLLMMIAPQPTQIKNKNLQERQPRLDNHIVAENGKLIQTYEADFSKVISKYQRNMSNFLATMEHLPEFTSMRKYMKFSGAPGDVLEALRSSSDLGAYVDTVIRRRIGMGKVDQVNRVWNDVLTQAGKGSALIGLSSPFSGLKNLVIGTQMTIGVHGFKAFADGMKKSFSPMNWKEAREKGWLQLGTKELELKGMSEWWMKNVSKMTGTEAINRVIGGFAGEFNARQMISKLQGHATLYPNKKDSKIHQELAQMFNLKSGEIAFLQSYGLNELTYKNSGLRGERLLLYKATQQSLVDKIQHYGHIKSQGASGDPFLPLWMGHPNAKAMTLFYRMAYSGTSNIFNHVIKPAKDGNFLPMARYAFASNVGGAVLWGVYESMLGQSPPKMNETQLAVIGQNMAKAETLGLYSFLLNPYNSNKLSDSLSADSLMQPAVLRNTANLGEFVSKAMAASQGKADFIGASRDLLTDSIVVAGHAKKLISRVSTPFKGNIRNVRTFRNQFEKSSGLWEEYNKGNPFSPKHNVSSEYYSLIKDAFSGRPEDMKLAARYYVATWYYLYDSKRVFNGYEHRNHKTTKKNTDNALNNVIKKINPLYIDNQSNTGKLFSTRSKFLQYLKPEERVKALNVEKEYYHRLRQFNKLLHGEFEKQGGYYQRGKIIDMFPLPTNGTGVSPWLKTADIKKILPNI